MAKDWISKEADLPLEVVILLIGGLTMLITGSGRVLPAARNAW